MSLNGRTLDTRCLLICYNRKYQALPVNYFAEDRERERERETERGRERENAESSLYT
jgi:hypothetical protein